MEWLLLSGMVMSLKKKSNRGIKVLLFRIGCSVQYSTELALALLKSDLTVGEKSTIIPYFSEDIITGELADEIIRVLSQQEVVLKESFLLMVMRHTRLEGERMNVLNYTLEKNAFDEDVITSFLESLPFPVMWTNSMMDLPFVFTNGQKVG